MNNSVKRPLVVLAFLMVAGGPFLLYFSSGLSFFTFHALSGLMPIKHQAILSLWSGEYPLWNPYMLNGAPFHSGIGILDPFLFIAYLFTSDIHAAMLAAYLSLAFAGLSMYLYLHKAWLYSIPASILGGMVYMLNPFFAATCHETPFMSPPIVLPLVFLFYEKSVEVKSYAKALIAGLILSLSFLSGNLESFYFVMLFFFVITVAKTGLETNIAQGLKKQGHAFILLAIVLFSALLFSAFDLLPSIGMMLNSERSANAVFVQNLTLFTVTALLSVFLARMYHKARIRIKDKKPFMFTVFASLIFLLFVFDVNWKQLSVGVDTNIIFPRLSQIMVSGMDSFHYLVKYFPVSEELLRQFIEPRFIFYIQPPIYLFTLSSLFIFCWTIVHAKSLRLLQLSIFALLLAVFPYSFVPNLFHYVLRLDQIAYPRIMFGFFFILSIIIAYGFEKMLTQKDSEEFPTANMLWGYLKILLCLVLIGVMMFFIALPADAALGEIVNRMLLTLNEGSMPAKFLKQVYLLSVFVIHMMKTNSLLFCFAIVKILAFIYLLLAMLLKKKRLGQIFVVLLIVEMVLAWNVYTFQTRDVQSVTEASGEATFLKRMGGDERVAFKQDSRITPRNFYEWDKDLILASNMPLFWNARTIEGAALNLSPKQFNQFWRLENENQYTPTVLNKFPSKVYDLMGMNYLLSDIAITDEQYEMVEWGNRFRIYENKKALPRFYFAENLRAMSDEEIQQRLHEDWDIRSETLIAVNEPKIWSPKPVKTPKASLQVLEETNNTIKIKTKSKRQEFLATTEAYHPAWQVSIDGVSHPIVRTNHYFRGVFVDAGEHIVRFEFSADLFKKGIVVTMLTFLLLLSLLFNERRRLGKKVS